MGLDMYLNVRKNISKVKSWTLDDGITNSPEFEKAAEATGISKWEEPESIYGIEVQAVAAYWRKTNAIHNWFVQNVQHGKDDCGEYYVAQNQLEELVTICDQVIADPSKAEDLLPTQDGFFFGNTDYDEWYHEGIRYTSKRLKELLKLVSDDTEPILDRVYFMYSSSW